MGKLIPPDLKRCQAEVPNGVNFMTLGGRQRLERCKSAPVIVATERRKGKDGKRGSMSLCGLCFAQLHKQIPNEASYESLREWRAVLEGKKDGS